MNELIDQFCESRRRWLIVTAVTAVLVLLTLVPLADQYCTLCDENAELGNQLGEVERVAADLPVYERRVVEKLNEMEAMDLRTVTEQAVGGYRNRLIAFARESGCQVRRISFGAARKRPWFEEDDAMETAPPKKPGGKPTPFVMETRPVTLSVAGSMSSVKKLINRVQADQTMQHVKYFELRPTGKNRRSVQMELELWCYALGRQSA